MNISLSYEEVTKVFRLRNTILERRRYGRWEPTTYTNHRTSRYIMVSFNGRHEYLHRILWILYNISDIPLGYQIDHIDGDAFNNTKENLRLVTPRENEQNLCYHREGKLAGTYYRADTGKWRTKLQVNGIKVHIGYFATERQAHEAYTIAVSVAHTYRDTPSFRKQIQMIMMEREKAI